MQVNRETKFIPVHGGHFSWPQPEVCSKQSEKFRALWTNHCQQRNPIIKTSTLFNHFPAHSRGVTAFPAARYASASSQHAEFHRQRLHFMSYYMVPTRPVDYVCQHISCWVSRIVVLWLKGGMKAPEEPAWPRVCRWTLSTAWLSVGRTSCWLKPSWGLPK